MTSVQETPQVFTLVLVTCVLLSIVVFLVIALRFVRGRRLDALSLLSRWTVCAVVYFAISVGVSALKPARIIERGQNCGFDEWCIAVEAVHRTASSTGTDITVTTDLRIYNNGWSPEGARGFWAFLRDDDGRRYGPTPGPWHDVVTSRVPGHGSARTSMDFVVPLDARPRGFVTNHGSGSPCSFLPSLLEIGQAGCLFHRLNMIRLD